MLGRATCRFRDASPRHSPAQMERQTDRHTDTHEKRLRRGAKLVNLALCWGCVGGNSWVPAIKVTTKVTMSRGQTHQVTHSGLSMAVQQKYPRMEGSRAPVPFLIHTKTPTRPQPGFRLLDPTHPRMSLVG